MTQEIAPRTPIANWRRLRDEWLAEVNRLVADVSQWGQAARWDVHAEMKDITEDEIGAYQVPMLTIQTVRGRLYFEPVARFVIGADGRIDLLGAGSFTQAVLLRRNGNWRFFSEEIVELPEPWSEAGFVAIAQNLLG